MLLEWEVGEAIGCGVERLRSPETDSRSGADIFLLRLLGLVRVLEGPGGGLSVWVVLLKELLMQDGGEGSGGRVAEELSKDFARCALISENRIPN